MNRLQQHELRIISDSPARTEALGEALGKLLRPGDIVCLSGDLGFGKTVFSRGIGSGWGAIVPMTSPSYNLAHEHERAVDDERLYHLDFYRISGPVEAATLGYDDILASGNILIFEWPERILDILPSQRLWIDFELHGDTVRELHFDAQGERHVTLLEAFRSQIGERR